MKISFIGTGYVGLVSGVMLAHLGHEITCIDIDKNKIDKLKSAKSPIYEAGLSQYLEKYANSKNLEFTYGYDDSLRLARCLFVTVGTPSKENGDADLSGIFDALENACQYINEECIVVLKSTVPPGTCKKVKEFLASKGKNIEVVSNPEFLREGTAVEDFLNPDRIVIGAESDEALSIMREVYKPLTDKGIPIVGTDLETSELIKYASNTFLANKIAFINEMADLCEKLGADVTVLAKGMGLDKRIGKEFLVAGPGFGGSCFPKDIMALQQLADKMQSDFLILDAIIKANNNRSNNMVSKISDILEGDISGKKISVLGITYKAGTDDLRNSPSVALIKLLEEKGAKITAYDPEGMVNAHKYFDNLHCASSAIEASSGSDAIIVATEWEEFKNIDLDNIKKITKNPVIIDLRNILDPFEVKSRGIKYYSIGRI